jgi:hypothetical protein
MSRGLSRLRRAVVLAVALVLVPTAALAVFRPSATATVTMGTATLSAPTNLSWSMSCPQGQAVGTVRLKGFTGVSLGESYLAQVSQDGVVLAEKVLSSPSQAVDLVFTRHGTVDLSIRAQLKSWTGPPLIRTFTC